VPETSICNATTRRPERLRRPPGSLTGRQKLPAFDLVVVDNGAQQPAEDAAAKLGAGFGTAEAHGEQVRAAGVAIQDCRTRP
jgi:hypothetical protein